MVALVTTDDAPVVSPTGVGSACYTLLPVLSLRVFIAAHCCLHVYDGSETDHDTHPALDLGGSDAPPAPMQLQQATQRSMICTKARTLSFRGWPMRLDKCAASTFLKPVLVHLFSLLLPVLRRVFVVCRSLFRNQVVIMVKP